MDLNPVKDAFDRVTKKQKLSTCKTEEVIDKVLQEIESSLEAVRSDLCATGYNSIVLELKKKLQEISIQSEVEGTQKELNVALSKFPKLLEKFFNSDISKAYRNVEFDCGAVNQIIAVHLYREGLFEVGDCFVREMEVLSDVRDLFSEMYEIVEAMKGRNLNLALKWAAKNSDNLRGIGSDLELKLHRLQFLEVLQKGTKSEALSYARTHMAAFATSYFSEFQKIMGCLLFAGKIDESPYSELLSRDNWKKVADELSKQFCNLVGQSFESPLSVTVSAGFQSLPPLLKFMSVMAGKKQEWQSMKQLPVPVELDKEYQFHSVFVCPVSKEQSTDENPPMLMSCGHALCKQSINKMSKSSTKSFKCPYCPSDIEAAQCKQLYF